MPLSALCSIHSPLSRHWGGQEVRNPEQEGWGGGQWRWWWLWSRGSGY